MTVHFAAARTPSRSPVARMLVRRPIVCVANDNGDHRGHDQLLHAALMHFAKHGLGAARSARAEADKAFFAGDAERYDWWIGICRTLDRRMAMEAEQQGAPASA
ncbi:MAG: hypothetical protein H6913_03470 [Altererythrobacter sp.]|nr:hypothetical protein [Altererythrobacter sp.]